MSYENPDKNELINPKDIRKANHGTAQKLREYATLIDKNENYVCRYIFIGSLDSNPDVDLVTICLGTPEEIRALILDGAIGMEQYWLKMIQSN